MAKLTDVAIRRAKPRATRYKLIDADRRGRGRLLCRIDPSGAKIFFFRYRVSSADRLIKIGPYDPEGKAGYTLARAIERARELGEQLQRTPDLKEALEVEDRRQQAERRAHLVELQEGEQRTLRALLGVYVAHLRQQGKRAAHDAEGVFARHVIGAFPHLAAAPAADLQARDVTAMMRRLIEAGKERSAGMLRSYLSAAYALALRAENDPKAPADALAFHLPANPAAATRAHTGVQARSRSLNETEMRHYIQRVSDLPEVQRDALGLMLLLGGQRAAQVLRVTVDDVDLVARRLTLYDPKGRRSEPRAHVLPLEAAAHEIAERRVAVADSMGCAWLFTSDGKVPLRLETVSGAVAGFSAAMVKAKEARSAFQLRDVRRTCETMLAELGISRDVRAQLLSHGVSGVQAQHYDRHEYMREKSAALAAWERRLRAIAAGKSPPANVVALKRKRAKAAA
jgi:integrase